MLLTSTYHLFTKVDISPPRLEPNHTENHDTGKEGGDGVSDAHDEGVGEGIVVGLGVAGESNEGTGGHSQGEEDLGGGF